MSSKEDERRTPTHQPLLSSLVVRPTNDSPAGSDYEPGEVRPYSTDNNNNQDLRDNKAYLADHMGSDVITYAQGEELRKQIGAVAYIECSSKTQQNVKSVFDTSIKAVLQPLRRKEVAVRPYKRKSAGCSFVGIVCGGCAA